MCKYTKYSVSEKAVTFFGLLVVFFFKSSNRSQFIWTAHKLKSADWVKSDWLTGTSLNMVSSWRDNNKKSTCMNLFQKQINRQFAVLIHATVSSSELWYYQGNGDKNIPMIDNWRINENWSLWSKCFFWGGKIMKNSQRTATTTQNKPFKLNNLQPLYIR